MYKAPFLNNAICLLLLSFYCWSCSPKIKFTAEPATISKDDSVFLNWKVKGKPTLMFDQRKIAHSPNDSLEVLEFTLSVKRHGKEGYIKRQISVLPKESSDRVVLMTTKLKGDTLIAEGTKDTVLWKNYRIDSISSAMGRPLIVLHAGTEAEITDQGSNPAAWKGKEYAGYWKIMTLLTEAEKKDHSLAPASLEIKALIYHR